MDATRQQDNNAPNFAYGDADTPIVNDPSSSSAGDGAMSISTDAQIDQTMAEMGIIMSRPPYPTPPTPTVRAADGAAVEDNVGLYGQSAVGDGQQYVHDVGQNFTASFGDAALQGSIMPLQPDPEFQRFYDAGASATFIPELNEDTAVPLRTPPWISNAGGAAIAPQMGPFHPLRPEIPAPPPPQQQPQVQHMTIILPYHRYLLSFSQQGMPVPQPAPFSNWPAPLQGDYTPDADSSEWALHAEVRQNLRLPGFQQVRSYWGRGQARPPEDWFARQWARAEFVGAGVYPAAGQMHGREWGSFSEAA